MKKISVVVPCYNVSAYLDQCMKHLLEQTIGVENIEIILVDDVSTDSGLTWELIMKYEKEFPDTIIAISLERNMRQGGARNVGISYASGEYLMFCDADDCLALEAMEHLYRTAREYDTDVIDFREKTVWPGRIVDETVIIGNDSYFEELDTEEKRKRFLMESNATCTFGCWRKFYKMTLIHENNIQFVEHLIYEEPSFTFPVRLYETRHFFLDETLYFYYIWPESSTHGNVDRHRMDNIQVWISLVEDMKERKLLQKYYDEIGYMFFRWGYELSVRLILQEGDSVMVEEIAFYVDKILELFPNIRENPYLKESGSLLPLLMTTLDMEITEESVQVINQILGKFIKKRIE